MVRRTFEFGKIDADGIGRRVNLVTIDVELKNNRDGFPEFSAFMSVLNSKGTDIRRAGKVLFEEFKHVPVNDALYQEIRSLWRKYDLHTNHAGTKIQESALKSAGLGKGARDYDKACVYLEKKGLYTVKLTPTERKYNPRVENPHRYGHNWIYYPIPATDLAKIKRILGIDGVRAW